MRSVAFGMVWFGAKYSLTQQDTKIKGKQKRLQETVIEACTRIGFDSNEIGHRCSQRIVTVLHAPVLTLHVCRMHFLLPCVLVQSRSFFDKTVAP